MNQQNQSFLVQSWANYQSQNTFLFKHDCLSDHLLGLCLVDFCGGA